MLRIKLVQIAMVAIIVLALLTGCATERHISPTISEAPRAGLELKPPILGAVFDGRATQEPKDAASRLQADLSRIYGTSIEWNDYFNKTPPGPCRGPHSDCHTRGFFWKSSDLFDRFRECCRFRSGQRHRPMGAHRRKCVVSAVNIGWIFLRRRLVERCCLD